MWLFICGLVIGGLLFGTLGFIIGSPKSEEEKPNKQEYIRRGIWTNEYSSGVGANKNKFEVQYELGELEATATKSKVEIISSAASKSAFNDDTTKNSLYKMVNHTWILSSEIECIEDTARVRNEKIDQLLSKYFNNKVNRDTHLFYIYLK